MSAEEFLDDMLRAITMDGLSRVLTLAEEKKVTAPIIGIDVAEAVHSILDFIYNYPAHIIWLWIRRGLLPQGYSAAIVDPLFQKCIMALALINTVSTLRQVNVIGSEVSFETDHFIVELALATRLTWSDEISKTKLGFLQNDKRANLLPNVQKVLILGDNYIGPLPSAEMPRDLIDTEEGIIYGPDVINDRWVGLEEILRIKSKQDLGLLLGVPA